jgi:hypothetical protein
VKSASVVGDVMKNYHPHGDSAIYDTLVRMAQTFSMRYPLVDPQGNFGNIDDYRRRRCAIRRLASLASRPSSSATSTRTRSTSRPTTTSAGGSRRPCRHASPTCSSTVPRGSQSGWRRTSPHNLSEVIDGVVAMIDDPEINVERLSKHVKGPDFPTGGIISAAKESARRIARVAAASSCALARTSKSSAGASRPSSSPSSRTA